MGCSAVTWIALAITATGCFFDASGVGPEGNGDGDGGPAFDADPNAIDAESADAPMLAQLIDTGLVARYFMDDESSGTAPQTLGDSAPNPLDLPINYGNSMAFHTDPGGARGIRWTTAQSDGIIDLQLGTTKFSSQLAGSRTITLEVVVAIANSGSDGSESHIAGMRGGNPDFVLTSFGGNNLRFFRVGGTAGGTWLGVHDDSRMVLHLVFDTNLGSNDRIKLYKNGDLLTKDSGSPPGSQTTTGLFGSDSVVIGNSQNENRSLNGKIYYVAFYNVAMSQADITNNTARLLNDDDQ